MNFIFNLEFPGSDDALTSLILRMDQGVRKEVKKHLLVDYLFMLGTYPGIAILCFIAARSVYADSHLGSNILHIAGMSQIVAWLCDAIENRMLLQKLKKPVPPNEATYNFFKWIVGIKFFIALTAITSTIFTMLYIWLIGGFPVRVTLVFSALVVAFIVFRIVKAIDAHYKRKRQEQLTAQLAETIQ